MRFFLLVLGCFIFSSSQAYWAGTGTVNLNNRTVNLEARSGQLKVEIIDEVVPTSEGTPSFLYPIVPGMTGVELYLNADGQNFESLRGAEKLDTIFEAAKKSQNTNAFAMYQSPEAKLLKQNLELKPSQPNTLKLKYQIPLDFMNDVYFKTVFLKSSDGADGLEIVLNTEDSTKHILPVYHREGQFWNRNGNKTWWLGAAGDTLANDFQFYLSQADSPTINLEGWDGVYQAELQELSGGAWNQINVIIDTSGSMYGDRWDRTASLVQKLVLDPLKDQSVQLADFSESVNWWTEGPTQNTPEYQQKALQQFNQLKVQGKSDFENLTNTLNTLKNNSQQAVLLVGDFDDFVLPESFYSETFQSPIFILDFAQSEEAKTLAKLSHGHYVSVFNYEDDLLQWEEVKYLFQVLSPTFSQPELKTSETDKRPLFSQPHPYLSQIWMSKKAIAGATSPTPTWMASYWGRLQISHHLRSLLQTGELSMVKAEAILALQFNLGIFDTAISENNSSALKAKLEKLSKKDLWELINKLENRAILRFNPEQSFIGTEPIHQTANGMEPLSFYAQSASKPKLTIKPWSEAHKSLWKNFPKTFAPYFQEIEDGSFCEYYRCLSLSDSGDTAASFYHNLYWNAPFPNHWSKSYIEQLAKENIFPVYPNTDLNLNTPITRGEFINWVGKYHYEVSSQSDAGTDSNPFSDLKKTDVHYNATLRLVNEKIIQGFPDGTLRADQPLTRAEGVKVLLAVSGYDPVGKDFQNDRFTDLGGWVIPWVMEAEKRGIVKGYEDKTFRPHQSLTRAEGAKILAESKN